MKQNSLITKLNRITAALKQERIQLSERVAHIDEALASISTQNGHVRSESPQRNIARTRTKVGNKLTLREAITRVTEARPLTKPEIIAAIQRIGYRFTTSDPAGSVNAFLYGKAGKQQFRNDAGKFSAK